MEQVLNIPDVDAQLIQQCQEGVPEAFEKIVSSHQRIIRAFVVRHLGNLTTADEVAQDVFVAAFRGIDTYIGTGSVASWLLGIARNHVLTFLRNKTRSTPLSLEAAFDTIQVASLEAEPFDADAEELRLDALRSCIQSLEATQRDTLTRFYYHNESADDIGRSLNKPAGTVRMILLRLRKSLRNCITSKICVGGTRR